MICTKCRAAVPDDAVLCCYCGKRFVTERKTKKRGNGQGTAFKRGNTWTAQVTIGRRDLPIFDLSNPPEEAKKSRQTIRRSKGGFATKSEALAYCPTLLAAGGAIRPQIPRLEHYWSIYSSGEMEALSGSTKTAYRIAWKKLEPLHYSKVDCIAVSDLRRAVSEKCKTYDTAKDCQSLLSHLFELAAADGYANKDLPSFIVLPEIKEKEREAFSPEEQEKLWRLYESGNKGAAIPLVLIYTGMMPGEARKLKVENIDMENRIIIGAGMKTKVRKKTPMVLALSILPVLQDLIDNALPSGNLWTKDKETWYKHYYAAVEAAGCRRLSPYCCRHTTATALAITEGIAPQTVKKVMRWSSTRMMDRYVHPSQQDALDAVDTIGVANAVANVETAEP